MHTYYCYPYRYAHKPLCKSFKKDVINFFNKIYVCRGCFFLYLGIFSAILLCSALNIKNLNTAGILGYILIFAISHPTLYKNFPRFLKDIVRFLAGMIVGSAAIIGFQGHLIASLTFFLLFFFIKKKYNKIRMSNKINACNNCPELKQNKVCSGYLKQTQGLRLLEEAFSKKISLRNII